MKGLSMKAVDPTTSERQGVTPVQTVAAHVAAILRAEMKDRALTGAALADDVGRTAATVSRRLTSVYPLVYITDDLVRMCQAMDLDPLDVLARAVQDARNAAGAPL